MSLIFGNKFLMSLLPVQSNGHKDSNIDLQTKLHSY
jgi:hypothetical protein